MTTSPAVPAARLRLLRDAPIRGDGDYVVYWMIAARRLGWNFALDRAIELAHELKKPLVILEALRCDYPHASDRLHAFVLQGMAANRRAARGRRVLYYPYVEPTAGAGHELLPALAARACAVVTDWSPAFFLPAMLAAAGRRLPVRLEAVDSNGIIPLSAHGKAFAAARFYRSFVQRVLVDHVTAVPRSSPLDGLRGGPQLTGMPAAIARRWPAAEDSLLRGTPEALQTLPIDHSVAPVALAGGHADAERRLTSFVASTLSRYDAARNHPDDDATSRLSPYLHFGHISAHEIFAAVMTKERWTTRKIDRRRAGAREGWWHVSPSAEAFLDQLVVWRELAFNAAEYLPDYTSYDSLPAWARDTLAEHRRDRRPHRYTLADLEAARTSDPVWNAAMRQLRAEGWFHGYLRMLWGKKILEWSPTPEEALERMQWLMDRYSLDGRDPNSYAGYAWVLGRYDRPWPEHPVFGTVRRMTSASAMRKLHMKAFLATYGDAPATADQPGLAFGD